MTGTQLKNLCEVVGIDESAALRLLSDVLGPAAQRPLSEPPIYPSDVADDATPVEYSLQFQDDGSRRLRILAEALPAHPGPAANLAAARQLVDALADRYHLALDRLRSVQDLFSPDEPQGKFSWWFSFIFDASGAPKFKVYFNPHVRGADAAPRLVKKAFDRLGMAGAHETVHRYALRRDGLDDPVFFALDLDDSPHARVKLYVSQRDARPSDAQAAADAVPGIDPALVREFCAQLAPDTEVFTGRPLVSSYSFVADDVDKPSNYSLYLPIRDYVPNDAVARERIGGYLPQVGVDPAVLDRAIGALTDRPLAARAGLLAHISLRLSPNRIGTTVYLSSEAYGGTPAGER
ncbi:tryptophan dimethylallyltransferase family protein [Saccharopolyspora thermophila]|uniref:tryptophan dimethylallyltransferase family protein n=1 Tax=Saccharopolyspora thermophila TaxID=89367 RepID=UPI001E4F41E6|nr:tryptophan dimethylallyltransferase family protein [Saccharopolyspora subtropica]